MYKNTTQYIYFIKCISIISGGLKRQLSLWGISKQYSYFKNKCANTFKWFNTYSSDNSCFFTFESAIL